MPHRTQRSCLSKSRPQGNFYQILESMTVELAVERNTYMTSRHIGTDYWASRIRNATLKSTTPGTTLHAVQTIQMRPLDLSMRTRPFKIPTCVYISGRGVV
jgi:hypothetical protein